MLGPFGRILIIAGSVLLVLGVMFFFADKVPWLGRLPGDIWIKKGDLTFYFPLTTCIILSVIATLIYYFFTRR